MKNREWTNKTIHYSGVVCSFFCLAFCEFLNTELQAGEIYDSKASTITIAELKSHLCFLASDSLGGRPTGSPGFETAARYAADDFKQAGLQPIMSDSNGAQSFFQPVPFRKKKEGDRSTLIVQTAKGNKFFSEGKDFKLSPYCISDFPDSALPMVFIGYGIEEPDYGWNDFENIDSLDGQIAVMLMGLPRQNGRRILPEQIQYKYETGRGNRYRYEAINKRNPAALIEVVTENMLSYWDQYMKPAYPIALIYTGSGISEKKKPLFDDGYPPKNRMFVTKNVVKTLFKNQIFSPEKIENNFDESYCSFTLDNATIRYRNKASGGDYHSWNVVAMVEGTDPNLKNEYITIGAHLDHISSEDGTIYNGADDNASGVTGVLEIAEAVAMQPPPRSVIFVLYTAEELGLFGSRHFVNQCPVPLKQVIVNINLDMIGRSDEDHLETRTQYVYDADTIGGWLKSTIINVNHQTLNWPLEFLRNGSSDQKNFLAKGIPSAFFFSGMHEDVHKPTDDPDKIDYDKMQKISQLVYEIIMEIGYHETIPR